MALEGTLRDFSFADILQLISLQRKTGVLTLKNEGDVVTVSFLEGKIIAASSLNQHSQDRLGLILLKQGALDEAALEAALRRQEETLQRLGRILIDHAVVSAEVVRAALEQQVLQIIYRVFRWSDGEYHFSQETDVDFDRDLMVPMVVDSIIMEGARMTDEWPFIEQKIPDRSVVFRKVDPTRRLEVAEEEDDLEMLGFAFSEAPEEPAPTHQDGLVTPNQFTVYQLVNGKDSVDEIILRSSLLEFETCKALAELLDRGLIREATPGEIVQELSAEHAPARGARFGLGSIPWLAIPFLVLLGISLTLVSRNPLNPQVLSKQGLWTRYVVQGQSWFRLAGLVEACKTGTVLTGVVPESVEELVDAGGISPEMARDPWGRPYRLSIRGHRIFAMGNDASGQPAPRLVLSDSLPWEGPNQGRTTGPGVVLLD